MSVSRGAVRDALDAYERVQPMFQGRGAELSYRLAEIVRGLTSDCRRCGGDGVLIDDNPESTQQIVTTCHECAGRGYEGLSVETAETAREER